MGLFDAVTDFVEDEIIDPIAGGIEDAFDAAYDLIKDLGDELTDWMKPDLPDIPGGTLVTSYFDPSKPPLIYGTRKTAGRFIDTVIIDEAGDPPNEYLHMVVLYCEAGDYGVEGFREHYFNDIPVSSGEFDGYYDIYEFTGRPGENLPAELRNNLSKWTSLHTLDGWAGAYYKLRWKGGEGKQPFTRKPSPSVLVDGLRIKSFDLGVARFSKAPIEILWDYLRHQRYGWGLPPEYLEPVRDKWQSENTFANNNNMTCNVLLDLNRTRKQLLDTIRQDFRINMPPRLGETFPVIEKDMAVVKVLTDDDVAGPMTMRPLDITKRLNRVTIRWNDKIDGYKSREYTYPDQATHENLVLDDGGRILEKTISAHCIDNEAEAYQLAFVALNRSRNSLRLSIPVFPEALELEPTDLIQFSYSEFSIANGIFRVESVDMEKNKIEVVQHNANDYPWQGHPNQNPSGGLQIPDLSRRWAKDVAGVNLQSANHSPQSPDDDLSTITVTVTPPISDPVYSHARVRYRKSGGRWFYSNGEADPADSLVVPYEANATYEIQVRSISRYDRASDWIGAGTVNLGSSSGGLPNIQNLRLSDGLVFYGKGAYATWDLGGAQEPQYFSHYEVQITDTANLLLKTYTSRSMRFSYSFDDMMADGAGRDFKIKVTAVSRTGNKGLQSSITVSNPLPTLPSGQDLTAKNTSVKLKFNPIAEPDFTVVKVWISTLSGFVAAEGSQVITTPNNQIDIEGLQPDTLYYLRYSVLDAFHNPSDIGVLSPEIPIATPPDAEAEVIAGIERLKQLDDQAALEQLLSTDQSIVNRREVKKNNSRILDVELVQQDYAGRLLLVESATANAGVLLEALNQGGNNYANAALYVDVDGTLAGMFTSANNTTSDIVFKADNFKFKTASGTKQPLAINGDDVEIVNAIIKSSINLNNNFVVDSDGNADIKSGTFSGAISCAGGFVRASQNSFLPAYTPNGTRNCLFYADASAGFSGVAGIVGLSQTTYGGYFQSDSGDALRGISESNDGVNGTSNRNGKAGVRASNEAGPQIILGNGNETTDLPSGMYEGATFPAVTIGGFLAMRTALFYGYSTSGGTKRWGRVDLPVSATAGASATPYQ